MYIYARINKDTLRFIREKKAISFDYVTRITKFKEEKINRHSPYLSITLPK